VILMIEKAGGRRAPGEILAVPGIDMIQWGPGDYTVSIGKPGPGSIPETKAVERKVIEAALRRGIPARAEIAAPEDAQYVPRSRCPALQLERGLVDPAELVDGQRQDATGTVARIAIPVCPHPVRCRVMLAPRGRSDGSLHMGGLRERQVRGERVE